MMRNEFSHVVILMPCNSNSHYDVSRCRWQDDCHLKAGIYHPFTAYLEGATLFAPFSCSDFPPCGITLVTLNQITNRITDDEANSLPIGTLGSELPAGRCILGSIPWRNEDCFYRAGASGGIINQPSIHCFFLERESVYKLQVAGWLSIHCFFLGREGVYKYSMKNA